MKKTLLSFVLTFILLITLGTFSVFADEADFTTAEYTYISADGTETVGLEVTAYSGNDTDIYIPSNIGDVPVLKIGDNFLAGNTSVNSVTLGAGIKEIGDGAFSGVSNMVCALLNEDIEVIGSGAFSNMPVFNSIILWDSVTSIGDGAFVGCPKLTVYCNEGTAAYNYITENAIDYVILNPEIEPNVKTIDGVEYYISNGKAILMRFDNSHSNEITVPAYIDGCPVTEINDGAFKCTNVVSIILPNTIVSIGDETFRECNSLESVVLPQGLTTIGDEVFCLCKSLTSITIPDSVCKIGYEAFTSSGLTNVQYPSALEEIGQKAFAGTKLTLVLYPSGVYMDASAFYGIDTLKNVVVAEGVTEIATGTFWDCRSLESVELPQSLKSIGVYAFKNCSSLEILALPSGIESILSSAFDECFSLIMCVTEGSAAHTYAVKNEHHYCIVNDTTEKPEVIETDGVKYLIHNGEAVLLNCDQAKTGTFNIPEKVNDVPVTKIGKAAFSNSKLNSVVVPATITEITDYAFEASSLNSIVLHDDVVKIGDYAFSKCYLQEFKCPANLKTIGKYAFNECGKLKSVTFNSLLESVGDYAFYLNYYLEELDYPGCMVGKGVFGRCSMLKKVNIPDGISIIPDYSFTECSALGTILIPESVTSIGANSFYKSKSVVICGVENSYAVKYAIHYGIPYCIAEDGIIPPEVIIDGIKYNITDNSAEIMSYLGSDNAVEQVIVPETVNEKTVDTIRSYAFYECQTINKLVLPDTITDIEDYAFSRGYVKNVNIPAGIKEIKDYTFEYSWIESVDFPSQLKKIGNGAFSDAQVKTISAFPDTLTHIGSRAFADSEITNIPSFPDSLEYIGDSAFFRSKVTSAILPADINLGNSIYWFCQYIVDAVIEDGVEAIPQSTFEHCHKLTNIVVPDTVVEIGESAFSNCWELSVIIIPKSVISIGNNAFYECPKLILYVYENSYAHNWAIENSVPYHVIKKTSNPEISYGTPITGSVSYTDGSIASGVTVEIFYDDGEVKESVTTNENGEYSFTYAEVGRYTIRVNYGSNTASEQVSVKRKNVFDVILTGETDLVLKRGYTVSGSVLGEGSITVTITDKDGNVIDSVVTENGSFEFDNIPNGDYIIKTENEDGSITVEVTVFGGDVTLENITIEKAEVYVTLFGKVVVKDRENEEHEREWAQVTVYNSEGVVVAAGKTDENGNYSFAKLPVGEYTVKAEATEMREDEYYSYIRPHVLKGYAYADALEAGEYEVETIVLTEEKSASVSVAGKVTAQGEHQECQVILMNENRDELARYSTNRNGKYQFDNVRDGYYILCAITEHDGAGFTEVTVKDGVVYGETDIRVYKSDRVSAHESAMLSVPDCETADEAEKYRENVMSEKNFYDSLPDKEKKMFSEWYIVKLDKLVKLLSGYEFTCDGAEVTNGGLIVSEEEVSTSANPHFTISVVEMDKWEKNQSGIETDEDYYQTFVEEAAGDNELCQYYDITLECEKNGKTYEITDVKKHTDTTGKIRLTMPIPEQYKGHKNYAFVHIHNGVPTTLVDLDDNPDTITFEIDRFSTFALMFNDEEQADLSDFAILNVSENTLVATSTTDATLFVVTYEQSGRMSDVKLTKLYADTAVEVSVEAAQKAFVLDSTMSPLCEEIVVG